MSGGSSEKTGNLPDFIIGGAMKSATSSLRHILAHHNCVFIPGEEIHFFCMDDPIQHRNHFFPGSDVSGQIPNYDRDLEENLKWYKQFFRPATPEQWIGEDSTIYLAAPEAPHRIARLVPEVKLIFMLRNPVDRAYSHYWHRVRKGRAVFTFPGELQRGPGTLLLRGFYKTQLERYFSVFRHSQIKVVLFERFIEHTQAVLDEICSFLGLPSTVDTSAVETHHNKSTVPRWVRGQLLANYFVPKERPHCEHRPPLSTFGAWVRQKISNGIRQANLKQGSPPPMSQEVRERLGQIFADVNQGLSDLIGVDLGNYWPHMDA
jgi:hypothetical protein